MGAPTQQSDPQARPTSAVSYVVASASQQVGVKGGLARLPHTVIRAPGLIAAKGPEVDQIVQCLLTQTVTACILPVANDIDMKNYLVWPHQRSAILARSAGQVVTVAGLQGVAEHLPDRSFVCLHYSIGPDGSIGGTQQSSLSDSSGAGYRRDAADEADEELVMECPGFTPASTHPQLQQGLPTNGHSRLKLYTLSCRLEMYVQEGTWHKLPHVQQCRLLGAMHEMERRLGQLMAAWNHVRLQAYTNRLKTAICDRPGCRSYLKTEFFFRKGAVPDNYQSVVQELAKTAAGVGGRVGSGSQEQDLLPVGITTYNEVFSEAELAAIEAGADALDERRARGQLHSDSFHCTAGPGRGEGEPKRTKMFFGARYLWTRDQMEGANSHCAGGVRVDVPVGPSWLKDLVEQPLVKQGIVPHAWINSYALNHYHSGEVGIQSHFDDVGRFQRPITSLRLFSDSRLSFGTSIFGSGPASFYCDMPRGCVLVMEGYAADGVRHCVRPIDMTGKSAGLILRAIQAHALGEARALLMAETLGLLRGWSMKDAPVAADRPPHVAASGADRERVRPTTKGTGKRSELGQIRQCMDSMLRQVERRMRAEDYAQRVVAAEVRRVLDRCTTQVELAEAPLRNQVRQVINAMVAGVELSLNPGRGLVYIPAHVPGAFPYGASQHQAQGGQQAAVGTSSGGAVGLGKQRGALARAPASVCFSCEQGGGGMWSCEGACRRSFHAGCRAPLVATPQAWCTECASASHSCGHCGQAPSPEAPLQKCSMRSCGRHYHPGCVAASPLTSYSGAGRAFRCPVHYCAHCGRSGDAVPMLQCIRCATGYHIRCTPAEARIISKKLIVCPKHLAGQQEPSLAEA
ncbi:hypothetical protein WJX72_003907 [[Myrmecia] bisecta]|uniref:Zinc finger PHD-type domain-containing protein n=1 Tax=[Myrmecia] bisecta TaxID=41462 RepID=A0AAW1Q0M9_9CHLO